MNSKGGGIGGGARPLCKILGRPTFNIRKRQLPGKSDWLEENI